MVPSFNYKVAGKKEQGSKTLTAIMVVLLIVVLFVSFYFAFYKSGLISSTGARTHFKEALSQVCMASNTRLEYEGMNSFFQYLQQPQQNFCPSWIKLERRGIDNSTGKNDTFRGSGMEEETGIANWQYVCIPEEDELLQRPCLVYSFTQYKHDHIENHFQSRGCNLHVFHQQVPDSDYPEELDNESLSSEVIGHPPSISNGTSATAYEVSEHPRDIQSKAYRYKRSATANADTLQAQSLDSVVSTSGHMGQRISFVNVDVQGQEWPLLTQLITFHDIIDVQQVSARIHLPVDVIAMSDTEKYLYFSELHQIFEGLHCLGYKLIRSQPLTPESDDVTFVEMADENYPMAYEVIWMKTS